MKSLVVFVAGVLAVALAATPPNPPNLAVKEESGKCVWSIATPKPTAGCSVTKMPGEVIKELTMAIPVETTRQAKMTTQLPLDKASIQNRITMTQVERLTLESQLTVIENQLKTVEAESQDLKKRLDGDPADPKKVGITKAIQNYKALMEKLAAATDKLMKA
ncbi:uncharacterized protein LOC144863242 [Branchiostoma floridae x Branchiostoma japonicum]